MPLTPADGSEIEIEVDVRSLARAMRGYRLLIMQHAASYSERASSREEQEATLRQIFDTIPDGVILIDEAGLIEFLAPAQSGCLDMRSGKRSAKM